MSGRQCPAGIVYGADKNLIGKGIKDGDVTVSLQKKEALAGMDLLKSICRPSAEIRAQPVKSTAEAFGL